MANFSRIGETFLTLMTSDVIGESNPKMIYYSSTRKTVYVMMAHWNTAEFFEVQLTRQVNRKDETGANFLAIEMEKLEVSVPPGSSMVEAMNRFQQFLVAHVNQRQKEVEAMLYVRPAKSTT